jgi:hypothetical protein
MLYRRLPVLLVVAGCAQAGSRSNNDGPDAAVKMDAPPIQIDAPCMPTTTQLLANPSFDATPAGMGWTATPVDPTYPLVTDQDGVPEQSTPYKAWLGGFAQANANDQIHQDVMIPPNTTKLSLTGFYDVRTADTAAVARDTATVVLTRTDGTMIDSVLSLSNLQPKTVWTQIDHTFPVDGLSGQTVRLRMASSNDATANTPTSFYFDTLALSANHCP